MYVGAAIVTGLVCVLMLVPFMQRQERRVNRNCFCGAMKSYDQLEGPQLACTCRVSRVAEITVRLRGDVS
jgi:hypothetical protein